MRTDPSLLTGQPEKLFGLIRPFHWRLGLVGIPGVAIVLLAGRLITDPLHAAIAAGAAFSVGFGLSRDLLGQRWGAMAAAMTGMALAGALGTVAGAWFPILAIVSAGLAALCAVFALSNEDFWWVTLQVVIAFMMAGYFPGGLEAAGERALAMTAGGMVEIATVAAIAALLPTPLRRLPLTMARRDFQQSLAVAHAIRAALAVLLSLSVASGIGLAFDYWAPITALIVLKPGLHDTRARGWSRLLGTAGGCLLASLWAGGFAIGHLGLTISAIVVVAFTYSVQKASYEVFSAAVTITVVFLVSLGQGDAIGNAEHRLLATVIGGLAALLVSAPLPHRRPATTEPDRLGQLPKA
ncbi:FUSC family protein [Pleomorphomonas oryzae]|uniref:FUSC family protein n=1 Tax=Pleomorphomonas oryzae TaxID=261934 RepID=UPI0004123B67|nr:FUSC family protein [Pleomorphomonas oryzae]